jgi:hypothetical protein
MMCRLDTALPEPAAAWPLINSSSRRFNTYTPTERGDVEFHAEIGPMLPAPASIPPLPARNPIIIPGPADAPTVDGLCDTDSEYPDPQQYYQAGSSRPPGPRISRPGSILPPPPIISMCTRGKPDRSPAPWKSRSSAGDRAAQRARVIFGYRLIAPAMLSNAARATAHFKPVRVPAQ